MYCFVRFFLKPKLKLLVKSDFFRVKAFLFMAISLVRLKFFSIKLPKYLNDELVLGLRYEMIHSDFSFLDIFIIFNLSTLHSSRLDAYIAEYLLTSPAAPGYQRILHDPASRSFHYFQD